MNPASTPKAQRRLAAHLQRECDAWNARHPVGRKVFVRKDNGEAFQTETRSMAQVLSGHTSVIWVGGMPGCYSLDRVHPQWRSTDQECHYEHCSLYPDCECGDAAVRVAP